MFPSAGRYILRGMDDDPHTPPLAVFPVRYCLRMQGHITFDWSDWLPDAEVRFEGEGVHSSTTVIGTVRDQAALSGLLSFIRNMGIWLVSIQME